MTCLLCGDIGSVLTEDPDDGKSRGGLVILDERPCPCTLREAEDLLDAADQHPEWGPVRVRIASDA